MQSFSTFHKTRQQNYTYIYNIRIHVTDYITSMFIGFDDYFDYDPTLSEISKDRDLVQNKINIITHVALREYLIKGPARRFTKLAKFPVALFGFSPIPHF